MDVFIPQGWKNTPRAEDKRRKILKLPRPRQTAVKHLYARLRKRKCRNQSRNTSVVHKRFFLPAPSF